MDQPHSKAEQGDDRNDASSVPANEESQLPTVDPLERRILLSATWVDADVDQDQLDAADAADLDGGSDLDLADALAHSSGGQQGHGHGWDKEGPGDPNGHGGFGHGAHGRTTDDFGGDAPLHGTDGGEGDLGVVVEEGQTVTLNGSAESAVEPVRFDLETLTSYGGKNQDRNVDVEVLDDGATLHMTGNGWKDIELPYEVTPNTVIEFDFRSDAEGEIHGIGFDNNDSINSNQTFRVYGTQNWGLSDYDGYEESQGEWKHYRIPVGEHYTGEFDRLFFVNDHDSGHATGESYFSNVRVYEADEANVPADNLTYTWVQTSGPKVELSDPNAPNPTFTAPEGLTNTDLAFELHVSDGENESVDTMTVTVQADNDAPSAEAGDDQRVEEGARVQLAATGTDPEGQGLTYAWRQVEGPSVKLSDPSASNPSFDTPDVREPTTLEFEVEVSDGENVSVDTVAVAVDPVQHTSVDEFGIDGLVARWKLDETGGSRADDAVNNVDGTLTNMDGDEWSEGQEDGALTFDGVDDYVHLEEDMSETLGGTATVTGWIRTTQTGSPQSYYSPSIIGNEQSGGENDVRWGFIDDEGRIGMGVGNDLGARSDAPVNDGEWHHVAFTRDADTGLARVYVDGELSNEFQGRTGLFDSPIQDIGRTNDFNDRNPETAYFEGSLDDVRIYDSALSAEQIELIAAGNQPEAVNEAPDAVDDMLTTAEDTPVVTPNVLANDTDPDGVDGKPTEGLIGHWKLDGDATDASGHGNDGTLHGADGDEWGTEREGSGAATFDGQDDIIRLEDNESLQLSNDYTMSVWINPDETQNPWAAVFSKATPDGGDNHWTLQFDNQAERNLIVYHPGGGNRWDTGVDLDDLDGEWHQVTITRSDDTMSCYVDGELRSTGEFQTPPGSGTGHLNIGGDRTGSSRYLYTGQIDELRVYDRALTPEEVAGLNEPDGDKLEIEAFTQAEHGTVEYNGDGTFTYTPEADYYGTDTFTYTVHDGHGGTDTATVTVEVTPVEDGPEPVGFPYAEDFTDGEAEAFDPVSGEWTVEDGTYEISGLDAQGDSGVAVIDFAEPLPEGFEVDVQLVSHEASGQWQNGFVVFDYNGPEDFKFAGARVGADYWTIGHYDGSWHNLAQVNERIDTNTPYDMHVRVDGGEVSLSVNGQAKVSHEFDQPVNSGQVGLAAEHAESHFDNFAVNELNDAPTVDAGADLVVQEGESVTLHAQGVDPEGQDLTYTWRQIDGPRVELSDAAAPNPTFTSPNIHSETTLRFEVEVDDGELTSTDVVEVTVEPLPAMPVSLPHADDFADGEADGFDAVSGQWDLEHGGYEISGLDVEGENGLAVLNFDEPLPENLDISVELNAHNVSGQWQNGFVVFDYNGPEDFKFAGARVGADYWTIGQYDGSWNDLVRLDERIDTDTPYAMNVQIDGGQVRLSADGVEKVRYEFGGPVNQGQIGLGADHAETVFDNLSVEELNRAPEADAGADFAVDERELVTLSATGSRDADGNPLTYAWRQIGGPTAELSDPNGAEPTFEAMAVTEPTRLEFEVEVSDGQESRTDTVVVTVNPVNDAPEATGDSATGIEDRIITTENVLENDFDLDGDTLTVSDFTQPAHGTVEYNDDGTFTYTPDENYNGEDSFTYTVTDGNGATDTATVDLFVEAVNDGPDVDAGPDITVDEGSAVELAGSATDPETQDLTYRWVQTSGPKVELSDPSAPNPTFTAPEGLTNTDFSFELHVSDGTNESVDTMTVTVHGDNDAPSAEAGDDMTVDERAAVELAASGTDPEGQGLTYAWRQIGGPSVELSDAGLPNPTFTAPEVTEPTTLEFQVEVSDGQNVSVDTVQVAVNPVDEVVGGDGGMGGTQPQGEAGPSDPDAADPPVDQEQPVENETDVAGEVVAGQDEPEQPDSDDAATPTGEPASEETGTDTKDQGQADPPTEDVPVAAVPQAQQPAQAPSQDAEDGNWDGTEDLRVLNPREGMRGVIDVPTHQVEVPSFSAPQAEPAEVESVQAQYEPAEEATLLNVFIPEPSTNELSETDLGDATFDDVYEEADQHDRTLPEAPGRQPFPGTPSNEVDPTDPGPEGRGEGEDENEGAGLFARMWALVRGSGGLVKSSTESAPHRGQGKTDNRRS